MSHDLETLFKTHKAAFDSEETPTGHQNRFMEKLNNQQNIVPKKRYWLKSLAIAATFLILIAIGSMVYNTPTKTADLASVSTEMEQTQSFFTTTINQKLNELSAIKDPELTVLISETLEEITLLETQYNALKEDLLESGQDSRVIAAMISNFQDRITLLEHVLETIEEVKTLKNNTNEITL